MALDLGTHLWHAGYRAVPDERARQGGGHAFVTSLLGHRAVVVRGRDAVRLFYDERVVEREGAMPAALARLLFGSGAVHGLDGGDHARRKAVFLETLTDESTGELAATIGRDLERRVEGWHGREVTVFGELVEVYGVAVLAWAGVPQRPAEAVRTSHRLAAIVDGFGGAPLAYPRAWAARLAADRWARRLVRGVRAGRVPARPGSALRLVATGPGRDLDPGTAGVELLNVLRPTVAVAWPATFLARSLLEHPRWRPLVDGYRGDDGGAGRTALGHEVRRTCPFVPALAGRARTAAEVDGVRIEPGDRIVLDVPGTNRDPRLWPDPDDFLPERFGAGSPDPWSYVPQGGGHPATGHRCPGEPLTVAVLDETARVLAGLDYQPVGGTAEDPTRIPTLPEGGLRVRVA
jgi:fatty-acid peroxygenase